jgi:hypothetical protein
MPPGSELSCPVLPIEDGIILFVCAPFTNLVIVGDGRSPNLVIVGDGRSFYQPSSSRRWSLPQSSLEMCAKGKAADVAAAATRDSACTTSRSEDAEPCRNDVQVEAAVAQTVASIAVVDEHLLRYTLLRRAASHRITRSIEGHHNESSASLPGAC